jgi:hypothetical protein
MTISVRAERKKEHDVSAISHSPAGKKSLLRKSKQASIQIQQKLIKRDGVFTIFGKANDHESFFFSSSLHHGWFDMRA